MPGESTQQSLEYLGRTGALAFTVESQTQTVWVTLSGFLDHDGLSRVVHRVQPLLARPGIRIVLDGARLLHVDFRTVAHLVRWSRSIRAAGQRLELKNWSRYVKTILAMEDWERELVAGPCGPGTRGEEIRERKLEQPSRIP